MWIFQVMFFQLMVLKQLFPQLLLLLLPFANLASDLQDVNRLVPDVH